MLKHVQQILTNINVEILLMMTIAYIKNIYKFYKNITYKSF